MDQRIPTRGYRSPHLPHTSCVREYKESRIYTASSLQIQEDLQISEKSKMKTLVFFAVAIALSSARPSAPALPTATPLPDASPAYRELRLLGPDVLRAISSSREGEVKNRKLIAIPVQPCKSGPKKILRKDFIGGSQFIYYSFQDQELLHYRSCNGLKCPELRCVSRYNQTKFQYVLKIKVLNTPPYFEIVGFVPYKWVDHVRCDCESCQDIKEFDKCRCEDNCPNVDAKAEGIRDSFCQWRERVPFPISRGFQYAAGSCYCCRVPLSCPRGKYFHRGDCQCKCRFILSCKPGYYFSHWTCRCERLIYTIRPTLGLESSG